MATSRIFVTGGTGRIGQPLVTALVAAGHDVVALARSDGGASVLDSSFGLSVGWRRRCRGVRSFAELWRFGVDVLLFVHEASIRRHGAWIGRGSREHARAPIDVSRHRPGPGEL